MAQKTVVTLEDDLDGGTATETVDFSLDGKPYEIDLSSTNAEKLRDALAPFVARARRASGGKTLSSKSSTSSSGREESQAARVWLQEHGYPVRDRGRIPSDYLDHYRSKTPAPPAGNSPKSNVVEFRSAAS